MSPSRHRPAMPPDSTGRSNDARGGEMKMARHIVPGHSYSLAFACCGLFENLHELGIVVALFRLGEGDA
jgi:hypothetical protein